MTDRLDRLERAGLVMRRPDPKDRRGKLIVLTDPGKRLLPSPDGGAELGLGHADAAIDQFRQAIDAGLQFSSSMRLWPPPTRKRVNWTRRTTPWRKRGVSIPNSRSNGRLSTGRVFRLYWRACARRGCLKNERDAEARGYSASDVAAIAGSPAPATKAARAEAVSLNPKLSVASFRARIPAFIDSPPGFREALIKAAGGVNARCCDPAPRPLASTMRI